MKKKLMKRILAVVCAAAIAATQIPYGTLNTIYAAGVEEGMGDPEDPENGNVAEDPEDQRQTAGIFTFQKIWAWDAPIVRMREMRSPSTEEKPLTSETATGKKVVSTTRITFGRSP